MLFPVIRNFVAELLIRGSVINTPLVPSKWMEANRWDFMTPRGILPSNSAPLFLRRAMSQQIVSLPRFANSSIGARKD